MKKIISGMAVGFFTLVAGVTFGIVSQPAWAATETVEAGVTVVVDPILSVTEEVGDFTLTFNNDTGSAKGDLSTNKVVSYFVKANGISNAAIPGALSARISALLPDVTLVGNSGVDSYTNNGSPGNAVLEPADLGVDIPMSTTAVAIFDKPASVGMAGMILNGQAFVSWNAIAKEDLAAGSLGPTMLIVTLKDS